MSLTKRWLEDVSMRKGHGGEINKAVLKAAEEEKALQADRAYDQFLDDRLLEDGLLDPRDL